MCDQVGRVAVNFEPGECFAKAVAVGKCVLGARGWRDVAQAPLKAEKLAQPLDVAARERQYPQPGRGRITAGAKILTERHEQAAKEYRIRQRLGRRLESGAMRVQRSERSPQRLVRTLVQLA